VEGVDDDKGSLADWRQWVEGVDWTDWRSLLVRLTATDWTAGATSLSASAVPADVEWQAPSEGPALLRLRAYAEDHPGPRVQEHLVRTWPAFRRWWTQPTATPRPTAEEAKARLEEHMPELVAPWEQLRAMLPSDPEAAALLALWNPPPFLTGCSQAVVLRGGPALVRNYDWDYRLFDGVVARTAYTGRRVLGTIDCLWGLLDGVNDAGLTVSLTFGGRPEVGQGFGIPLVVRYVLEVCGNVDEAVSVLRRIPVHMSYNVTVLDRSGRWATVCGRSGCGAMGCVAPDRAAQVTDRAVTTNHQGRVEWAPYAAAIRSVEREERLEALVRESAAVEDVVAACLGPPLYATRWHQGFGTLYTAEYRPSDGVLRYHWPRRTWEHSLEQVSAEEVDITLG
jgi:predicted choloylglycine hydrolase